MFILEYLHSKHKANYFASKFSINFPFFTIKNEQDQLDSCWVADQLWQLLNIFFNLPFLKFLSLFLFFAYIALSFIYLEKDDIFVWITISEAWLKSLMHNRHVFFWIDISHAFQEFMMTNALPNCCLHHNWKFTIFDNGL